VQQPPHPISPSIRRAVLAGGGAATSCCRASSTKGARRTPDSDAGTLTDFADEVKKFNPLHEDINTWFDLLDLEDHCSFGGNACFIFCGSRREKAHTSSEKIMSLLTSAATRWTCANRFPAGLSRRSPASAE
jgi:hypothetical protein